MADDAEKTEQPTSKKIQDARKDGNVPKSQDTSGVFTLLVAILTFMLIFSYMYERLTDVSRGYFRFIGEDIDKLMAINLALVSIKEFLLIALPLAVAVAIAGIVGSVAQFGFLFTTKPITPDFSKLNPIKGIKNVISLKKLVDGLKVTLKSLTTLGVGFFLFFIFIKELPTVAMFGMGDQFDWLSKKLMIIAFTMLFIIFVFAMIDLFLVRKRYIDGLKMSKQEVKDEFKNMEGDPRIKNKIRQIQMKAAMKRMMAEVPKADVVITNPTHYAVAIKYDEQKSSAPLVVAKGMDNVALQIKEVAREHGVPVVQNPPLARQIYAKVELDQQIPNELFAAVAEVLAYVYKLNRR
ncbi:MAG: flagellar biosynthesis protein FlhB [Sulfurimonadaceae bacterium]|jgi:flagellar biosynthetic protein FlhB|nr:flagellar biosynthesis protein FlhB [Sulfurimonadaceae bacterium]